MTKNIEKTQEKRKKYGWKFWLVFWVLAALALLGWYVFLQVKNKNIHNLKPLLKFAPVGGERRNELQVLADIYEKMGGFSASGEKTFLLLLQNDMELRPGGGFIGSFGIAKTKNGKISDIQIHDTGVFDGRIPEGVAPPAPIAKTFHINSWKLRDSNWSPDFPANAEKAEYFYYLGGGTEPASSADKNFDGVIAVNTRVLNSILSVTGPVKINDYPGEYSDETAVLQLEYQVEKGYIDQGIEKGDRKSIMKEMAEVLAEKMHNLTFFEQLELARKIEDHLKQKDIQMFFRDEELQKEVDEIGWSGRVRDFSGDYLMAVDANLNALKSDICIKRKMEYAVDLSRENPQAELKIAYEHTCRAKDWMTADYNDFLRVFAPTGTWFEGSEAQTGEVEISRDLEKNVFARGVFVPIGETRMYVFRYNFPKEAKKSVYSLLVQKQSGISELPVKISVKKADGTVFEAEEVLKEDKVFSF
jgi:hypothetical protein